MKETETQAGFFALEYLLLRPRVKGGWELESLFTSILAYTADV